MENQKDAEKFEKIEREEQEFYKPEIREVYHVPKYNMGFLTEQIEKLNKKAKKLGLDPIIMEEIREYDKTIKRTEYGYFMERQFKVRFVEVRVTGKSPKFEGWTFVAAIEHDKASKNLIKCIPGIELDHKYRDAPPDCHHCNTNRWRKKTFVCRHDDGKEIQVGSTCVKDFLGHKSPESIAWQCEMLGSIREMFYNPDHGDEFKCPKSAIRIPIRELLEVTAQSIREHGWISKSKVMERPDLYEFSTADDVMELLFPLPMKPSLIDIQRQDAILAYGAMQWASALRPDSSGKFSDYFYNISVLANESSIGIPEIGLAASIVGVWKNKRDKEKLEKGPKKLNEHFGEIKKRYDLELTVKTISGFDGEWGYTTIYKMEDKDLRRFSWFSTSYKIKLHEGETYKLKATIKGHNEWKGTKETMLTRATLAK